MEHVKAFGPCLDPQYEQAVEVLQPIHASGMK